MTFDVYDAFDDPYSYKSTHCLKNRLGIRDAEILQRFELEVSSLRAEEPLPQGRFDPKHYRAVHHHLFQDVYRWAGRYRLVRTSKGGNQFCFPEHIKEQMRQLFTRLTAPEFLPGMEKAPFIQSATEFLADLNALHPFREGNGRSQLAFLHLVAERAGHPLHLELVRPETFMPAMIDSFIGNLDPLLRELAALAE